MPSARASQPPPETFTRTLMTIHNLYETYVLPSLPQPLQTISNQASTVLYQSYPYLSQAISLLTSLTSTYSSDSSLLSLGILLITLYIGLRIANYIRRTIFGWVFLGVKLVVFLLLLQAMIYVNNYGWEKAIKDASWMGGIVWGFLEEALEGGNNQAGGTRQPRGTRGRYDDYNSARRQAPAGQGRGRTRWT